MATSSAVPGMTVAEVRRGLAQIRQAWEAHCPERPLFGSDTLFNGMTFEHFAFEVTLSQHKKRHQKSARRRDAPRADAGMLIQRT